MSDNCEHLEDGKCGLYSWLFVDHCPGIDKCDCFRKGDCKYYRSENDIFGFCSVFEARTMCQGRSPECGY